MGFYREQVLPRFQDKVMDRKAPCEIRARVCSGLAGDVVEVGFGTGLNSPYYPAEVAKVAAVEPSAVCMRIAQPRIAATSAEVELAGLTGDTLDLPSEEFDAALSTWTCARSATSTPRLPRSAGSSSPAASSTSLSTVTRRTPGLLAGRTDRTAMEAPQIAGSG
jgi:hypothetical protein